MVQIGLIAQDVEKVFPEAVRKNPDGFLSVSYSNLVAPVVEAIKELFQTSEKQSRQIAAIQSENEANKLENKIKENQIRELQKENSEMKKRLSQIEKMLNKK